MAVSEQEKNQAISNMAQVSRKGQVASQLVYTASIDPEYVEIVARTGRHLVAGDGALPLKFKETLIVCLLAARSYGDRIQLHAERAMDAGATEAEIVEALEVTAQITGLPSMLIGVEVLAEVAANRKAGSQAE